MIITGKQKKYLRGLAHSLDPYIIIGKNGLTPSAIKSIDKSLNDHELIKVRIKVGDKDKLAPIIEKKTSSVIVGSIGKILILYKESEDRADEKIVLP